MAMHESSYTLAFDSPTINDDGDGFVLVDDEDYCSLIEEGLDQSLIHKTNQSASQSSNCCTAKRCAIVSLLACQAIFIVLTGVGLGLYESGYLPDHLKFDSKAAEAILPGHYVLLPYHFDNDDGTLKYSLLFTLPTNASNHSTSIYKNICTLTPISFKHLAELMPSNYSLNFFHCPDQTCFFDTYIYEVPSNESVITYNIANNNYVPDQPNEFEILAFDYIKQISNGSYIAPSPPIKTAPMKSRNTVFTLNSEEIKKSSYYFFAIKLVKGSSPAINRFTIHRSGIQALYNINASRVPPQCTLNQNNSCSITVRDDDYCIYLYSETLYGDDQISPINVQKKHTPRRVLIYPSVGSVIFLILTLPLVIYCFIKFISTVRKRRRSSLLIPYYERAHGGSDLAAVTDTSQGQGQYSPPKNVTSQCSSKTSTNAKPIKGEKSWMEYDEPICFDQRGLFHHFDQCGVTIDIPEGAVDGPAILKFGTSQMFPGFNTGDATYEPISSFIWVHIDTILSKSKPAKVYIPHWIQYDETVDDSQVCLLINHDEDDNNAVFYVKEDTRLQLMKSVACVEMTDFCSACLAKAIKDGKLPKCRYHVAIFERSSLDRRETEVHVCFFYAILCLKKIEEKYKLEGFSRKVCEGLEGISPNGLTLSIDVHHDCDHQRDCWKHMRFGKFTEKIMESDIDIRQALKLQPMDEIDDDIVESLKAREEDGSYPPRFKLKFYTEAQNIKRHSTTIALNGAVKLDGTADPFSVTLLLGDRSSIDKSCRPQVTADPEEKQLELEKDAVLISLMPFLANESIFTDSNSYFKFGNELGVTVDMMNQFSIKYGTDAKCTEQILLEWRKKSASPTYNDVIDALKKSGYPVLAYYIIKKLNIAPELPQGFVNIDLQINASDDCDLLAIKELLLKESRQGILQCKPSICELALLHPHICNKWKTFGSYFDVTYPELEVMENDRRNSRERFNDLIAAINRSYHSELTWEVVLKALYSPSVRAYKAIEEVYVCLLNKPANN